MTGWVAYHDFQVSTAAIRQAIEQAVARAPELVQYLDPETAMSHAADAATGWHFLKGWGGFGSNIAFWNGVIRHPDLIRGQIEAIAAVLPPQSDFNSATGVVEYDLQGVFNVWFDQGDTRPVEWTLYRSAVYENRREAPPSDERQI